MGLFNSTFHTLDDLFLHELSDLHSAETQLVAALPKMAEAANDPGLRTAFTAHLAETEEHVRRLEGLFQQLGKEPSGESCKAMEGLIKEANGYVKAGGDPTVRDAGLIGAAQRVEHYEIAGYGTARSIALRLGYEAAANTLQQTLDEEGETDQKLTDLAESGINYQAAR